MRLAISAGVMVASLGARWYDDPRGTARQARWWRERGAEGLVFYDNLPGFYEVPLDHFGALKAALDDVGLPAPVFNALRKSLHMPALADTDQQRLAHCLAVCALLGGEILDVSVNVPLPTGRAATGWEARQLFRGDTASDAEYAGAAARLKTIAQECARHGIALSIELHDDGLQDTADNCLRLVALIDEPNVGVNPDLGNWYRVPYEQRGTWRDELAALAPTTNYWEVKNYARVISPADGRAYSWPTDLDAGDIDFRSATVMLWDAGFRGWVANEGGHGDRVTANLKYLAYMRGILDEWIPAQETT